MAEESVSHSSLIGAPPTEVRAAIRRGAYAGHTAGLAAGYLQCNLAILPERYALIENSYGRDSIHRRTSFAGPIGPPCHYRCVCK